MSLANNRLYHLSPLVPAQLLKYLPNIRNLSLAQNELNNIGSLRPLFTATSSLEQQGLTQLKELILTGNPLVPKAPLTSPESIAYRE